MNDTKSLIIFITLSAVLLVGIGLLPESSPKPFETFEPAPELGTPFGWTVTVKEYK